MAVDLAGRRVIQQELFGTESGDAAGSGRDNGLAINGFLNIPAGEHARNGRLAVKAIRYDITV